MKVFILDSLREMLGVVFGYIPTLVTVLAILGIGLIIARMVGSGVARILKEIKIDKAAKSLGLADALDKGGVKSPTSAVLGSLTYWILAVIVLVMGAKHLGLPMVDDTLGLLFGYIPSVVAGVLALLFGMILAKFVSTLVKIVASNTNIPNPDVLASLTKHAIVIFSVIIFLKQLGLAMIFTGTTFHILFAGLCLALAISFGLGGRDAAAKYIKDMK